MCIKMQGLVKIEMPPVYGVLQWLKRDSSLNYPEALSSQTSISES